MEAGTAVAETSVKRKRKTAAKKTRSTKARTAVKKTAAKKAATGTRGVRLDDAMKIVTNGEHTRREGSRYFKGYELLRKVKTVGEYLKKGGEREILRAAIKDKFAKVS